MSRQEEIEEFLVLTALRGVMLGYYLIPGVERVQASSAACKKCTCSAAGMFVSLSRL